MAAEASGPVPVPKASVAARVETPSEKYLRQIRNVVVAWFVITLVGAAVWAIAVTAVAAHDHALQQQASCSNNGGVYVNGQCL